jgi:hypothetical protein
MTEVYSGREQNWMPTLAGVLDICAAIRCLIGASVLGFLGTAAFGLPRTTGEPVPTWPFNLGFGFFGGLSLMAEQELNPKGV